MIYCDICVGLINDPELLIRDEDGLWVCDGCRKKIRSVVIGNQEELLREDPEPLIAELAALRGKNVGQIVLTLNLPYETPYRDIIDAAHKMHDMLLSPWKFQSQWNDGSTVWRGPDGSTTAIVERNGSVRIEKL